MSDLCRTLEVSRGGYYAFKTREPSARDQKRQQLVEQIQAAYDSSRGLYGSPRITAELRAGGIIVTEKTVAKMMKQQQIQARTARRFRIATTDSAHDWKAADNLLDRDFQSPLPDTRWCCDITCVPTDEGVLYLAALIDLCSRRIVGWSMSSSMKATLCMDALQMALLHRRPPAGLLHHSDRGSQYCCDAYQQQLQNAGILPSMSRTGNCYDNAVMESFWGTFKRELVYQQPNGRFATHQEARAKIFEYIEVFYNRQRRHSAIGYLSPEAFEASLN